MTALDNDNEFCPRCGWACSDMIDENLLPEGLPDLPSNALPHPVGVCCSPFAIGDSLYWNVDNANPDLPPLKVIFKELVEIESAHFRLEEDKWVKEEDARPLVASVVVSRRSVFPCHEEIFGEKFLSNPFEVPIKNLTPERLWPVMEIA